MTKFSPRFLATAVLGLGILGFAATSGHADTATTAGPVLCGVEAKTINGMLSLEATMLSTEALSGYYEFKVVSSGPGGNSNINQGGAFAANANDQISLGKVMINGGSNYKVSFDVNANGASIDCAKQVASLR
ncbi:curli-like amyloid fiber formation chaperone CsgH [Devosia sp.]|uniref:curli-like amyloid fiber formation chaperone CsgH n=1 Tax=Devosia sp. TaxID=1871048 RepID=UPI0032663EE9